MSLRKRSVLARCVLASSAVVMLLAVASTLEAADVDPVPSNDADAFTVTLGEVVQEPAIPVTTPVGRLLLIAAMAAAGIVAVRGPRS